MKIRIELDLSKNIVALSLYFTTLFGFIAYAEEGLLNAVVVATTMLALFFCFAVEKFEVLRHEVETELETNPAN